jgi:multiple sugar transport system substrate-binding protein
MACRDRVAAAAVRALARPWEGRQEARVEVREIAGAPRDLSGADVWVMRPAELPRWAAAGQLRPVPEKLRSPEGEYRWRGLLPFYREQLLLWNGSAYGLPLLGDAPLLLYRSDLFGDEKLRRAYREMTGRPDKKAGKKSGDLRPPATWEELAELAEFFRDHHPSGKPGPSLPPLPADADALDRLFYSVAACYVRRGVREEESAAAADEGDDFSFHYDLKTGMPRLAGPGFVHALCLLQRLQGCRPDAAAADPGRAFATGQAVLGVASASALVRVQNSPAVRDKFGMHPLPGAGHYFTRKWVERRVKDEPNRVPYLGGAGWVVVVPRSATGPAAAWDLLASLTGPEGSGQLSLEPRWGGGPTRLEQVSRERWDALDLDGPRTLALREALGRTLVQHGLKNPVLCLRTPDQAAHQAALVAVMRKALTEKTDPKEAMAEVVRRWKEIDRKKSTDVLLRDYRISLGLLGR